MHYCTAALGRQYENLAAGRPAWQSFKQIDQQIKVADDQVSFEKLLGLPAYTWDDRLPSASQLRRPPLSESPIRVSALAGWNRGREAEKQLEQVGS